MKNGKPATAGRGRKREKIPNYGRTRAESIAIKKMLDKLPVVRYRSLKEALTPDELRQWRKTAR